MSDDRFAELAARSAKVKNENLQLLQGLKAFEQKLLELVEGLGCGGNSETFAFDVILDQEGEPIGETLCYLAFTGYKLLIGLRQMPPPSWDENYWSLCPLEQAGPDVHRRVSEPKVLNSLVEDLIKNLDKEFHKTNAVVQSLSQYVTVEKAEIDADLDGLFSGSSMLLDSWLRARGCVLTDPELCITLSCSHIETVLKGCLKSLGQSGYEKEAVERLSTLTLKALRASQVIDDNTSQMLRGAATIFQCVGASRNDKSASHGKNIGYVPPTSDLAQTINHLAGIASVFVMKQTELVLKGR